MLVILRRRLLYFFCTVSCCGLVRQCTSDVLIIAIHSEYKTVYNAMDGPVRGLIVIGLVITELHCSGADDTVYGVSSARTGQLFRGIYVPGNYKGNAPQVVPGVALPTQERRFPDKVPFSPTNSVFGNSAAVHKGNSWGYGQAYHGVNPLDMDTNNLYQAYADANRPLKTDGQAFPFDHVFNVGGEYDMQKWKYIKGGMQVPTLARNGPSVFDLTGNLQAIGKNRFMDVDFPIPGTNERFPLNGKLQRGNVIQTYQYGQAIPNVNPFQLPREEIIDRLANGGNANPTFVG